MHPKCVLFEMASLLFLPFGINLCSGFSKKIMVPIQLLFFASYVLNMVLVGIKLVAMFQSKYLVILPFLWFSTTFFSGAANVFRVKQLTDKGTINVVEFLVHPACTNFKCSFHFICLTAIK